MRSSFVITLMLAAGPAEVNSHAVGCARLRGEEVVVRKLARRLFGLGLLAGIGYAVWRYFEKQRSDSGVGWEAQPFPYPPQPRETSETATTAADEPAWVEPKGDRCPSTHPIKAKLSSKIFHPPGSRNYTRTKADRCYADEASAQADGLRPALR